MATILLLFNEKQISADNVFRLAEEMGGYHRLSPARADNTIEEVVIEIDNGAIWISPSKDISELSWYSEEIALLQHDYAITAQSIVEVIVESSYHNEYCIALKYCQQFVEHFPDTYLLIHSLRTVTYSSDQISQMRCDDEGEILIGDSYVIPSSSN